MSRVRRIAILSISLAALTSFAARSEEKTWDGVYPEARRVTDAEVLHGVAVSDPYRWLEKLDSAETTKWIEAQDALSLRLSREHAGFGSLEARLLEIGTMESFGVPVVRGDHAFFLKTEAGGSRPSLWLELPTEPSPRLLVGADALGGGPERILAGFWPSHDGQRVAYGVGAVGSRWFRVRFLDTASGRVLPDELVGLHGGGSVAWSRDDRTVFYGRYAEPPAGLEMQTVLEHQKLYAHRMGSQPGDDHLVYERPDQKLWNFTPQITEDGRYLIISVTEASAPRNRLYYADLAGAVLPSPGKIVRLIDDGQALSRFLTNSGERFWVQTTHRAPRGRVVTFELDRPEASGWKEVIQQSADALYFTNAVADRLVAVYLHDAKHVVRLFDLDGRPLGEAPLPDLGTTFTGFLGQRADRYAHYSFNSISYPGSTSVFRFDPRSGESVPLRKPRLAFEPTDYLTRQVFFKSKDGTRVPMFIAHRKDLKLSVPAPAYLYAYGSMGWPATPWFQPQILAWMDIGGIYALANVRGGGEYGEEWHRAGILDQRQNAIDDFLAAAQWLVDQRLTTAAQLSINGGSASAPLAAAALTQRPEMFGAVTIDHPILDLLRFDRFTGGARWKEEFGDPGDAEDFRSLMAYSPLHALKEGRCYPPTLVTASDTDDTAVPLHAYKFVAAMQRAQGCRKPVLLQLARGAGHTSFGNTREQAAALYARQLGFLLDALGVSGAPGRCGGGPF